MRPGEVVKEIIDTELLPLTADESNVSSNADNAIINAYQGFLQPNFFGMLMADLGLSSQFAEVLKWSRWFNGAISITQRESWGELNLQERAMSNVMGELLAKTAAT